ncbi:MAG: hypothetical protein C4306_04975 [Thermoleophilia bacterium]
MGVRSQNGRTEPEEALLALRLVGRLRVGERVAASAGQETFPLLEELRSPTDLPSRSVSHAPVRRRGRA